MYVSASIGIGDVIFSRFDELGCHDGVSPVIWIMWGDLLRMVTGVMERGRTNSVVKAR
jgi:hypothetical protein